MKNIIQIITPVLGTNMKYDPLFIFLQVKYFVDNYILLEDDRIFLFLSLFFSLLLISSYRDVYEPWEYWCILGERSGSLFDPQPCVFAASMRLSCRGDDRCESRLSSLLARDSIQGRFKITSLSILRHFYWSALIGCETSRITSCTRSSTRSKLVALFV